MPRVPTQQLDALPGVRMQDAPAGAFGSQVGAGVERMGNAAGSIYADALQQANQVAGVRMRSHLMDLKNSLQTDFLSQQGEDALKNADQPLAEWEKQAGQIRQKLPNDEQRHMFDLVAPQLREQLNSAVQHHVATQGKVVEHQAVSSYLDSLQTDAAQNYNKGWQVQFDLQNMKAALIDHGKRNGWAPEYTQQQIEKQRSAVQAGVIQQYIAAEDHEGAAAYYKAHKQDLLPQDSAQIGKAVKAVSLRGRSQAKADSIVQAASDESAALKSVQSIKDPELRDATQTRVTQFYEIQHQAHAQHVDQLTQQADHILSTTGGNLDQAKAQLGKSWYDLPTDTQEALSRRSVQMKSGQPVPMTAKSYQIWTDAALMSPRQLAKISDTQLLTQYRPNLDDTHYERLVRMVADSREAVHKADLKAASNLSRVQTPIRIIHNIMRETKMVDPGNGEPNDAKNGSGTLNAQEAINFENAASEAINRYEADHLGGKRKATDEEIRKIVSDMAARKLYPDPGVFSWGTAIPAAALTAQEKTQAGATWSIVPGKFRTTAANLMMSSDPSLAKKIGGVSPDKWPVTFKQRVVNAYKAWATGNRDEFHKVIGDTQKP